MRDCPIRGNASIAQLAGSVAGSSSLVRPLGKDDRTRSHCLMLLQKNNDNQEDEVRVNPDDGLKKKKKKKKKGRTRVLKNKDGNSMNEEIEENKYMLALPFPQKQKRKKLDKHFGHFLEVLKQVHVNLPFTEVLSQMPVYSKLLKEILSVKWKRHKLSSSQNKLPKKFRDPGSFTIPCSLGRTNLKNLCMIQTAIILEGILKDVVIQLDKFVFPMDFIIVKIEENNEVLLILGRPFLATTRAIMDIQERQLMLRVGEERMKFKMKEAIGGPREE
uniref:Uncharacterized protein LOC104243533 n=1 Tax=Nicotiana sylvestris TaxID=4096 RepID=A0A1U7XYJ0_NICSY|nr:PREDICTED: uncharacterized protein LOC104243533 [Nicotiana sylvestris]